MISRCLHSIHAVHARNLTLSYESETSGTTSTSQSQARSGPFCFVTLRSPGDAPFYVTPIACGHQASWGEYFSAPIFPETDFQSWAPKFSSELVVGLYLSDNADSHWECAWEVNVNMRLLDSLGHELGTVRETQANCVYLGITQGDTDYKLEYLAVHQRQAPDPDLEEVSRRALQLSLVETQMRRSYSFAQACSLIHIEGDLLRLRQTSQEIRDRCGALITSGDLFDKVGCSTDFSDNIWSLDIPLKICGTDFRCASTSLCRVCLSILIADRASLLRSRNELKDRRAEFRRCQSLQKEADEHKKHIQETITSLRYVLWQLTKRQQNKATQRTIQCHRARLLRDIEFIYPIELVSARDLLYSILGIDLPNGIATTDPKSGALLHNKNLEQSAAALTYVAQIVTLLSSYLHTSLPYPVRPQAGRLTLLDTISVMKGPRRFGLYGKGTEPYRYEYGVFLLNKNLVQLMHAFNVPVLELRNTLPNVKNLLVTLASL